MADLFATPLRVVELGDSISASAAGMYLRQVGAQVTKVEPPEGSPLRSMAPLLGDEHSPSHPSAVYTYLNHGKTILTADLTSREGRATVERLLVEGVDIVLMSGTRDEWEANGLSASRIRELAPTASVGRISRYGDDGPHRDMLGEEFQFQAFGGLMYVVGIENREPIRMGGNVVQYAAGAGLFTGAMLGLYRARNEGTGSEYVTSVFEMVPYLEWKNALSYQADQIVAKRGDEGMSPVILPTKDGFSAFYYRPNDFETVKKMFDDPRLSAPEFETPKLRQENRLALAEILGENTMKWTKRDLYHHAQSLNLPIGYVATMGDLLESDQYMARAWLEQVDIGGLGTGTMPGTPFKVITPEAV